MTRALVTQTLEGLESGLAYVENEANQLTTREYKAAITAAREYLATEPSGERAQMTDEEKKISWTQATIELPSGENCYYRGISDAEKHHGIKS